MASRRSNDAATSRVGTVLKDKWHLDALLGVGGMAWVYAATHRNKNRVAIKLLFPEFSVESDVRKRFLREGYAANSIGHPGAVQVFDDDMTDDGLVFLVMELLEGKTLADLRRERGGRLDPKTVLTSADGVLDVLAMAHEKGVIHRDIKPGNIFVTSNRGIKVVDFGIARVRERTMDVALTRSDHLLGSATYMAPEQARSLWDQVDARTDLYSVGATMFQLLTGRPVHEGKSPQERILAAITDRARPIGSLLPSLPRSVAEVVDRALEYDQAGRWQSAREMQQAVRQALKRIDALGSTLVMEGPEPLGSSPQFDDPPVSPPVVQPDAPAAPQSAAAIFPASPRAAPPALGATRVYGSPEDAAALRQVREAIAAHAKPAGSPAPPTGVGLGEPRAAAAPSADAPARFTAPAPAQAVAIAHAPVPAVSSPHPLSASTASAARASTRRRRGWLVVLVIVFMLGVGLLALTGAGLWFARERALEGPVPAETAR